MTREELRKALEAIVEDAVSTGIAHERYQGSNKHLGGRIVDITDRVLRIIDAWDNGHMPEPLR